MKSPNCLLLLLTLTSTYAINKEQLQSDSTRELTMTQAQQFASRMPQLTTMAQFKAEKMKKKENKVTMALDVVFGKSGEKNEDEHEEPKSMADMIAMSSQKKKKTNVEAKTAIRKKDQIKANKEEATESTASKLSLALQQALKKTKGSSGSKRVSEGSAVNKAKKQNNLKKRSSSLKTRKSSLPKGL